MKKLSDKTNTPLTIRLISSSRYIVWLAVVCTFVGAAALMLIGTYDVIWAIWQAATHLSAEHNGELKLVLIESVDTFLVATVLLMIALGLYQLFVNSELELPRWLNTRNVEDLERRLTGMIVVVMAVIFLTAVIKWDGTITLLWLGLAIGVVTFAVSFFLYQETHHPDHD
ncbi:MAG: YqhA family protein [Anaerolineales bacterium]|nr:YqhA family protein [Anaerolineales bacterium]